MGDEQEIKELEGQVEELRAKRREVKESFSYMPDIQAKILRDLDNHERNLLAVIKKRKEAQV